MKDDRLIRLQAEVQRTSVAEVSRRLKVPRPTISLVTNERYPANPGRILAKFEAVYGRVQCPHLGQEISGAECLDYRGKTRPSNPIGLQHWRACQQCPHNPTPMERSS